MTGGEGDLAALGTRVQWHVVMNKVRHLSDM